MELKPKIILKDPYVQWSCSRGAEDEPVVYGRGYAFLKDGYFQDQHLTDFVQSRCRGHGPKAQRDAFIELIPELNGCWALVVHWPSGYVLAAADRLRSVPLFYSLLPGYLVLSSSIYSILDHIQSPTVSEDAALEYLLAGYVTGSDTIYCGIKQVRTGEIIEYDSNQDGDNVRTFRYYRFLPSPDLVSDERMLELELAATLDRVFARFAKSLAGRHIYVPLSGGLDSRMLVAMLRRHGVEDVTCFSYGLDENKEALVSRRVAEAIGYEWRFVEYSKELWAQWMASPEMRAYWMYSMQGCSLPIFQDLPAVATVLAQKKLPKGIFMPGHMGDFLSGSAIPTELYECGSDTSDKAVVSSLIRSHFSLWPDIEKFLTKQALDSLRKRLESQIIVLGPQKTVLPAAIFEMWRFDNRKAKFIVNSVRAYEFCEQDWAIPLSDYEIMDFFMHVPRQSRYRQRLYVNVIADRIFNGELKHLRDIPLEFSRVRSNALLRSNALSSPDFREDLLGLLNRLHLKGPLRQVRNCFKSPVPHHLAFDHWFTCGQNPESVSIRQVLAESKGFRFLPVAVQDFLNVYLSRTVAETSYNGLLAAITLEQALEQTAATLCDLQPMA